MCPRVIKKSSCMSKHSVNGNKLNIRKLGHPSAYGIMKYLPYCHKSDINWIFLPYLSRCCRLWFFIYDLITCTSSWLRM